MGITSAGGYPQLRIGKCSATEPFSAARSGGGFPPHWRRSAGPRRGSAAWQPRGVPVPPRNKAAALPGVKAVVTSADFPEQKFEYVGPERIAQNFWHMTRNIMAREKALYEGHAVAAVAATSKAIADEALSLIAVDYEVQPHVIDVDEAMKPDAPLLFPDLVTRGVEPPPKPSNISKRVEFNLGDLEAGFAAADEIVEMSLKTAPVHQAYIEPQGCVARCDADGRALELEPGALRRPRLHRAAARHEARRPARLSGGDRRSVRRQDRDLRRAGGRHARAQIRPSGEDRDEPGGRVQGHRPDVRCGRNAETICPPSPCASISAREGGAGAADLAGSIARVPVARQGFRSGNRSDGFSWRLAAFYAAFFGFSGIVMPFFPAWLQAKGLDSRATGIVLAVPMFIRLISVPSLARLADRRSAP